MTAGCPILRAFREGWVFFVGRSFSCDKEPGASAPRSRGRLSREPSRSAAASSTKTPPPSKPVLKKILHRSVPGLQCSLHAFAEDSRSPYHQARSHCLGPYPCDKSLGNVWGRELPRLFLPWPTRIWG